MRLRSEGPAGGVGRSVGGGVGGGGLNGFVRHDSGGELLLGLLETSAGGTIQHVHLERRETVAVSEDAAPYRCQSGCFYTPFMFYSV